MAYDCDYIFKGVKEGQKVFLVDGDPSKAAEAFETEVLRVEDMVDHQLCIVVDNEGERTITYYHKLLSSARRSPNFILPKDEYINYLNIIREENDKAIENLETRNNSIYKVLDNLMGQLIEETLNNTVTMDEINKGSK